MHASRAGRKACTRRAHWEAARWIESARNRAATNTMLHATRVSARREKRPRSARSTPRRVDHAATTSTRPRKTASPRAIRRRGPASGSARRSRPAGVRGADRSDAGGSASRAGPLRRSSHAAGVSRARASHELTVRRNRVPKPSCCWNGSRWSGLRGRRPFGASPRADEDAMLAPTAVRSSRSVAAGMGIEDSFIVAPRR